MTESGYPEEFTIEEIKTPQVVFQGNVINRRERRAIEREKKAKKKKEKTCLNR